VGRLHQIVKGTQHLVGLLPMGGGRGTLYYGMRQDRKEAVWQRGLAAWRAEVLELAPQAESLFVGLDHLDQVTFTTYQHVWLKRWHNNHVLFLGDAAHAMSPHLGQGVNLALLDAWTFAHCLERASTPRRAFWAYTEARRVHLRFYSLVTYLMSPLFQGDGWVKGWLRDLGLPLLARIPWMRRQMALTMAGLKNGFLGGRIRLLGTEP
jgi:2-polyprenyl-6-methoxyphenol hydroxylase-like FAD-dependent oxidoreductase